jgi:hypothetical protein
MRYDELVVVDLKREPDKNNFWELRHLRAGEQAVRAEIESIRFSLIERNELMRTQYFLRFRRKVAGLTFSGGEN